jgi:hypothetical protein
MTGSGSRSALSTILVLATAAGTAQAGALPEVKGWRRLETTKSFDAKTIWQQINGAAELYLDYGFKGLRLQRYSRKGKGQEIEVHVYDMGRPLHAFGIYWRERPTEAKVIRAAAGAAFAPPYHCLAFKSRYYVKAVIARGQLKTESCGQILSAIARSLPGSSALPREVSLLPSAGRVPSSIRFTRRGYMGLRELQGCLHAAYREQSRRKSYEVFVLLPGGKRSLGAIWRHLAARWKRHRGGGLTVLSRKVPYRGTVAVVRTSRGIYGASHPKGIEEVLEILRRFK